MIVAEIRFLNGSKMMVSDSTRDAVRGPSRTFFMEGEPPCTEMSLEMKKHFEEELHELLDRYNGQLIGRII